MTQTLMEWFTGRDEIGSRLYDFIEDRSVWETGWFQICAAIAVVCIAGFFWLGLK